MTSAERGLLIGAIDHDLGHIQVLVHFEDGWIECSTVYGQPSYCKPLEAQPE
jgi:hypothetical protein